MSGTVGDLSINQEKALEEMKKNTEDVYRRDYDNYYYLRWLRARNFDVPKAENMMRKHLTFRRRIGADTILTDYTIPELIDKNYPRGFLGFDKEGCPVRYMYFGNLDLRGFAFSVRKIEVLKFLTFLFEQDIHLMEEQSKKIGKVIERHSYIVDLENYTFRQATNKPALELFNEVLRLYESNYPERMKRVYFLNAPSYFQLVLALSKPFLSEATLKKFMVFGKDGYQQALLNDIDAEVLPKFLGGKKTDPDGNPRCLTMINYGGFVPKSCYFSNLNSDNKFVGEPGVQTIILDKRSCHNVDVPVAKAGSKLTWEFETKQNDIGVGLYFRKNKDEEDMNTDDLEEIIPIERVNCHLVPESLSYICEKSGTYVIKFDNSYSWFSSKKLYFRVSVNEVNELNDQEDFT